MLYSQYNCLYLHKIESTMIATKLYFGCAAELLDSVLPAGRVVVITDENICRLYPKLITRYPHIIIGVGEDIKTMDTVMDIYDRLMSMCADRSTFILGIGGGIVTDITGFVASTYMRGLEFGFVSTTLLGQVDASVGGKNGVNVACYKNMVGTITQPRFVISDVEMLGTLPMRELRAGMAEVVKSAIVGNYDLFCNIERCVSEGSIYMPNNLQKAVSGAVKVKMSIVEDDEREGGRRRLLNLGHTIGHAIEKLTHDVNHGEAVAMGMSLIARAAVRLGVFKHSDAERVDRLLKGLGFRLVPPEPMNKILHAAFRDKKRCDDSIYVVLPVAIGHCEVRKMVFVDFINLFV